jgi:hypothetical protein
MNDEQAGSSYRTPVQIVRMSAADAPELDYLRSVPPSAARRIMSAYQQAVEMAGTLRVALLRVGVIVEDADVDALLSDEGSPVVRIDLTPEGMSLFQRILARIATPQPPPGPDADDGGSAAQVA